MCSSPSPHPASRPSTPPQSNVVHQISSWEPLSLVATTRSEPSAPPWLSRLRVWISCLRKWVSRLQEWVSRLRARLRNLRAWLSENTLAVTGWAIAIPGMIFAAISLGPGFESQNLSKQALELAQWTALKDYIEQCQSAADSGTITPQCNEALASSLPLPPHVKFKPPDSDKPLISRTFPKLFDRQETYLPSATKRGPLAPPYILIMVLLLVLLHISVLLYLRCKSNRKTLIRMDEESVFVNLPYDTPPPNVLNKQPEIIQPLEPLPTQKAEGPVGISTGFEVALVDGAGGPRRRTNRRPLTTINRPDYYCPICFEAFKEPSDFYVHTKMDTCQRAPSPKELSRGFGAVRGQSDNEEWYRLWMQYFTQNDVMIQHTHLLKLRTP